jgi:rare lipoprotein A
MMNVAHNKPYPKQVAIAGTLLCLCFALGAQENMTQVIKDEKIGETSLAKPLDKPLDKPFDKPVDIAHAEEPKNDIAIGTASYYAAKFHGKRTASGEKFNSKLMTAAHRTLPFGTQLKVTNLRNKKSIIVRVNDRGPHVRGRIVDISRAAAEQIGLRHTGTARVALEILKP